MFASALAPLLARRGIHYGWVMVALTFLVSLASAGALGVLGALLLPVQAEYGWDLTSISGALALRLLLFGLIAPFAAALLARFGLRTMVLVAFAIIVSGLLCSMAMTAPWQLWLTWGLMTGVGSGLVALVLSATVASRWFTARRGLVVGILTATNATGQLIFLPLAAWIAQEAGWRAALVPGIGLCAAAALLFWLFARNHPSELGLAPYGETKVVPPPVASGNAVGNAFAALAEAARTRVFWILFITFAVCGLSTIGLVQTHFVPLCADFGIPAVQAASMLALIGAFDFVGTVLSGWLSDRYDNRMLLFWYYGLRGLSLLLLPFTDFSLIGLSVFAVFYGLDWVATVPPTVKLAAQAFGREKAPLVFGWIFTAHQLGGAVAALGAGWSRDALASYLPAFALAGAACLVAAVLALGARRPAPAAA